MHRRTWHAAWHEAHCAGTRAPAPSGRAAGAASRPHKLPPRELEAPAGLGPLATVTLPAPAGFARCHPPLAPESSILDGGTWRDPPPSPPVLVSPIPTNRNRHGNHPRFPMNGNQRPDDGAGAGRPGPPIFPGLSAHLDRAADTGIKSTHELSGILRTQNANHEGSICSSMEGCECGPTWLCRLCSSANRLESSNFKVARRCAQRLEALTVDDGRAALVVLLLRDPHLLERGERGEDRAADPNGVLALRRRDDLDLHRRRG